MSDAPVLTSAQIEAAIAGAGDSFTLASLAKTLGSPRSDVLRRRLERFIEADNSFFYDRKWHCVTRSSFFNGCEFIITPDEWEINQKLLFPGHRFVPFIPESVFPSDVELSFEGMELPKRQVTVPLGKIFYYHCLLGSEQIFDFMIAENPANSFLAKHQSDNEPVTLNVFDLQTIFSQGDFSFGDALLCQVTDCEKGKIACSVLTADKRSAAERKARIQALDNAIKQVWEEFGDYPDIPEQLAWAEFFAQADPHRCGASLDEFIASSGMVEIRTDGDHAVLSIRQDGGDDGEIVLPSGLSISETPLDDPLKLLSGNGAALNETELDSFMLDAIYRRESDIDGVFSRIFGHRELDMKDEAQQAVLLNYLEERFEELLENYNRADDEPKAELRSDLVDAVEARLEYLSFLATLDRDPNAEEKAILKNLAVIAKKITNVLKVLNNPAFTPDEVELSRLAESADAALDEQEELLGDHASPADEE